MSQKSKKSASRRLAPAGLIISVLGLLLFIYFIRKAGMAEIFEGVQRLGAGFLLILVISGFRIVVRALAWTRCFESPYSLRFRDAFQAYIVGDAVGNLVPLGIVVSEPAKAALVRDRGVPLVAGLSAIAVENIFYSLSVALFIFSGAVVLLLNFPLPKTLRFASIGALAAVTIIILVAVLFIRKQWKFGTAALGLLERRGLGGRRLAERKERVGLIEDRIYGFYSHNRSRFLPILLLEALFHIAGIAENYVTLYFISPVPPTLLTAFVLESVNRVINVIFKFVPLRVGVDEAGTGMLTKVLKFGTASGVTLAIVRKGRILFWTGVGVVLLISRGLSVRSVTREARKAAATAGAGQSTEKLELRAAEPGN